MSWAIASAIVASTLLSKKASDKASRSQLKGIRGQIAEMRRQFDITREDFAPFRELELERAELSSDFFKQLSNELLGTGPSNFQTSPGYQFRMEQGQKAVNRMMSSQGRLNTPMQDKAMTRYAQGLASEEYAPYIGRLFSGAGLAPPPPATQATASYGADASYNIGQAYQNMGTSRANNYINQANLLNNAVNQGMQYYGYRYGQPPTVPQYTMSPGGAGAYSG